MRTRFLLGVGVAAAMTLAAGSAFAVDKLIDISATGMTAGTKVTSWANTGTLGGQFVMGAPVPGEYSTNPNDAAVVQTVAGKTGVKFNFNAYSLKDSGGNLIGLDSALLGNKPTFTMSAVIHNTNVQWSPQRYEEYFFGWGPRADTNPNAPRNGMVFSDGLGNPGDRKPAIVGGANLKWNATDGTTPDLSNWARMTVTCDGTNLRLYIGNENGYQLLNERTLPSNFNISSADWTNCKPDGGSLSSNFFLLGQAYMNDYQGDYYWKWNDTLKKDEWVPNPYAGMNNPTMNAGTWFTGSIASLQLYNGALQANQLSSLYATGSPAAVPEPGTILAAISILAPAGFAFRRKRA